jgi:hypothetical protein
MRIKILEAELRRTEDAELTFRPAVTHAWGHSDEEGGSSEDETGSGSQSGEGSAGSHDDGHGAGHHGRGRHRQRRRHNRAGPSLPERSLAHAAAREQRLEELRRQFDAGTNTFQPNLGRRAARLGNRGDVFERLHKTGTMGSRARARGGKQGISAQGIVFAAGIDDADALDAGANIDNSGHGVNLNTSNTSNGVGNGNNSNSNSSSSSSSSSSHHQPGGHNAAASRSRQASPVRANAASEHLYSDSQVRREMQKRREMQAALEAKNLANGPQMGDTSRAAARHRADRLARECFAQIAENDCVDRLAFGVALEAMGYLSGAAPPPTAAAVRGSFVLGPFFGFFVFGGFCFLKKIVLY